MPNTDYDHLNEYADANEPLDTAKDVNQVVFLSAGPQEFSLISDID